MWFLVKFYFLDWDEEYIVCKRSFSVWSVYVWGGGGIGGRKIFKFKVGLLFVGSKIDNLLS